MQFEPNVKKIARRHRYISELHIDLQCALLTHPPDTKIRFAVRLTIATGKLDLPPQKKNKRNNKK